jgi:hypothetical protein
MSDAITSTPLGASPASNDEPTTGQRGRKRDSLFLAARLRVGGEEATDIRVRNLSEGGLMIDNVPPMAIGTALVVELRNIGAVPGRVAWYTEGRAGIAFDLPIDPIRARKPMTIKPVPLIDPRPKRR